MAACSALAFLTALAALVGGCSSPKEVEFTALNGAKAESQWEMHLLDGDKDTALTGAMAASLDNPGEGRLYVMLPFGQTLGKCVLSGGGAECEASAPGVGPLLDKAAAPMAKMLSADAREGGAAFGAEISPPEELRGRGWRCEPDGDWLVYSEDRAKWKLRLKRIK